MHENTRKRETRAIVLLVIEKDRQKRRAVFIIVDLHRQMARHLEEIMPALCYHYVSVSCYDAVKRGFIYGLLHIASDNAREHAGTQK